VWRVDTEKGVWARPPSFLLNGKYVTTGKGDV
jgi:hypothetical protein